MEEIDIWRAAQQMIEMYADQAGWRAALRANHLFDQGDNEGGNVWLRIAEAIKALQHYIPSASDPKH